MFVWLRNLVTRLWEILGYGRRIHRRQVEPPSVGQWSKDFKHAFGTVSYSAVQGREVLMECSEVDVCHNSTYVGVYDGHGSVDAARFISQTLLPNIIGCLKDGNISDEVVTEAFKRTEEAFILHAQENASTQQSIFASGSSCLVALVWEKKLIIGHLGSSRALVGQAGYDGAVFKTSHEQLTTEHSVNLEHVRQDFWTTHGEDAIVHDMDHDVWLIRGKTEVTRSVGDLYLKDSDYAITDQRSVFYLEQPIEYPLLTCNPTVVIRDIMPKQSYVVLASDGLWKYLSNQKVVDVINKSLGHKGIAEKLVKRAIKTAMKIRKNLIEQSQGYPLPPNQGPPYDDISVIVLFIDSKSLLKKSAQQLDQVSVRAFMDSMPSVMKSILGGGEPTMSLDTASSSNVGPDEMC